MPVFCGIIKHVKLVSQRLSDKIVSYGFNKNVRVNSRTVINKPSANGFILRDQGIRNLNHTSFRIAMGIIQCLYATARRCIILSNGNLDQTVIGQIKCLLNQTFTKAPLPNNDCPIQIL